MDATGCSNLPIEVAYPRNAISFPSWFICISGSCKVLGTPNYFPSFARMANYRNLLQRP